MALYGEGDMRGCFALFISAVISSICFNAHAQIAVFGISLGMSAEEILIEFEDNNYRAAYSDDDYGLPEDCVSAPRVSALELPEATSAPIAAIPS